MAACDGLRVSRQTSRAGSTSTRPEGEQWTLAVTDTQASVAALLGHLTEQGVALESLQTHAPTLEDVFMAMTGKHLRDG